MPKKKKYLTILKKKDSEGRCIVPALIQKFNKYKNESHMHDSFTSIIRQLRPKYASTIAPWLQYKFHELWVQGSFHLLKTCSIQIYLNNISKEKWYKGSRREKVNTFINSQRTRPLCKMKSRQLSLLVPTLIKIFNQDFANAKKRKERHAYDFQDILSNIFSLIGKEAKSAVPSMLRSLKKYPMIKDKILISSLADACVSADKDHPELAPLLLKMAMDTRFHTKDGDFLTVSAIGAFRDMGGAAVPYLRKLMDHPNSLVRRTAFNGLLEILEVRQLAIHIFTQIVPAYPQAIPSFVLLLDAPSAGIQFRAAVMLANYGKKARLAVPHLVDRIYGKKTSTLKIPFLISIVGDVGTTTSLSALKKMKKSKRLRKWKSLIANTILILQKTASRKDIPE